MLDLIHFDVSYYILCQYLHYLTDLHNLNILFDIQFSLKPHLHHSIIIKESYDKIDTNDHQIGAIRTFVDNKIIFYKYKNEEYTRECFYNIKNTKTVFQWDNKGKLNLYKTYSMYKGLQHKNGATMIWYQKVI